MVSSTSRFVVLVLVVMCVVVRVLSQTDDINNNRDTANNKPNNDNTRDVADNASNKNNKSSDDNDDNSDDSGKDSNDESQTEDSDNDRNTSDDNANAITETKSETDDTNDTETNDNSNNNKDKNGSGEDQNSGNSSNSKNNNKTNTTDEASKDTNVGNRNESDSSNEQSNSNGDTDSDYSDEVKDNDDSSSDNAKDEESDNADNEEETSSGDEETQTAETSPGMCGDTLCVNGACSNKTATPELCVCHEGWTGDSCTQDIDECEDSGRCDHVCENTQGSYQCSCYPGYTKVSLRHCADLNECNEGVKCGERKFCLNTEGSYQCVCRPGLAGPDCGQTVTNVYGGTLSFQAMGSKGQGWSSDLLKLHTNDFQNLATKVQDTISHVLHRNHVRHTAVYVMGFDKQDNTGESALIKARYQVSMNHGKNTASLRRVMESGFSGCDNNLCVFGVGKDLLFGALFNNDTVADAYDLCDDDRNNICHDVSMDCVTVNGIPKCQCREGFEPWSLFENACEDIDECERDTTRHLCGLGAAQCVNTVGSYLCQCPRTHRWDSSRMACVWANICKRDNPCLNGGECYNTVDKHNNAGFVCRCSYWWTGAVCELTNPEAELLKNALVGLVVVLAVCCIILGLVVVILCKRRNRSEPDHPHHNLPDEPVATVPAEVPTSNGRSPAVLRKKKTMFASYDLGDTPRRSMKKVDTGHDHLTPHSAAGTTPARF